MTPAVARSSLLQQGIRSYRQLVCVGGGGQHLFFYEVVDTQWFFFFFFQSRPVGCVNSDFEIGPCFWEPSTLESRTFARKNKTLPDINRVFAEDTVAVAKTSDSW